MEELLGVGSAQEVEWLRMPAKRLAIGPSLIPHEHVIVLDPSMPPSSLVYVSHDHTYHIDSFEFAY
jgi:L-ascorbate metabolism protein UlaG (beta-lactamase superfamily)